MKLFGCGGRLTKMAYELRRVGQQMIPFLDFNRHEHLVEILFASATAVAKDVVAASGDCGIWVECFGIDLVLADDANHFDGWALMKQF